MIKTKEISHRVQKYYVKGKNPFQQTLKAPPIQTLKKRVRQRKSNREKQTNIRIVIIQTQMKQQSGTYTHREKQTQNVRENHRDAQ